MPETYRRNEERDLYYEDSEPPTTLRDGGTRNKPIIISRPTNFSTSPPPPVATVRHDRGKSRRHSSGPVHYYVDVRGSDTSRRHVSLEYSDEESNQKQARRIPPHRPDVTFLGDDQHDKRGETAVPSFMQYGSKRPEQGPLSIVRERQQLATGGNRGKEPNRRLYIFPFHLQQGFNKLTFRALHPVILSGHALPGRTFSSPRVRRAASPKRNNTTATERERAGDTVTNTAVEFQAVYNSSHARDVTVHVELELYEDVAQELLEEFSRLTRVGHFRHAKSFFDENLRAFMDNPYVFVQYAEMLLTQGDYRSIQLLDDSRVFPRTDSENGDSQDAENPHLQNLRNSWLLIGAASLCFTQHEVGPIWAKMPATPVSLRKSKDLGSIEISQIALELSIDNIIDPSRKYPRIPIIEHWNDLYQLLTESGRVWEFRDIFMALCDFFGTSEACHSVFGLTCPQSLRRILDTWTCTTAEPPDESTLLALLDLFAYMALNSPPGRVESYTKACVDYADRIGDMLLQKFPKSLTSRPVLLWTLTKSAISIRAREDEHGGAYPLSFSYLNAYPGLASINTNNCIGLPYYIPIRKENPGWKRPHLPAKCSQLVETVLETAREHDDFRLQVLCLQELLVRSQDPSGLLDELAELQKARQLDTQGYLRTCLTKYLTCSGEDSARKLRMDLSDVDQWHQPSELLSASRAAARDIIRQALLPSSDGGGRRTLSISAGLEYYHYLPGYISEKIDQYVPRTAHGRDPRNLDTPLRRSSDDSLASRWERNKMKPGLAETRRLEELAELRKLDAIDETLATTTPQVQRRYSVSERPRPTGINSHLDLHMGRYAPVMESKEENTLGRTGDESVRDGHDLYYYAARPRLALDAPHEQEQPDLGPTVEEVSDEDHQRPEREPNLSSEWKAVDDTTSGPAWKGHLDVSSPHVQDAHLSAPQAQKGKDGPLNTRPQSVETTELPGPRLRSPSPVVGERRHINVTEERARSWSRSLSPPSPTPEVKVIRTRVVEWKRDLDILTSPASSHASLHDPGHVDNDRLDDNKPRSSSPQPSLSP